jgi:hypothetical protein
MNRILMTLLSLMVSYSVFAAEGFSSLEEQMTGSEFDTAGLSKLSKEELNALNSWIRSHSLATLTAPGAAAAGATQDRRGLKTDDDKDEERSLITSRIVGSFSGWDGQTIFKLENGMIWAQADKDKFYIKEIQNPVAIIDPGMFGTWRLSIEGHKKECKVKRIQ